MVVWPARWLYGWPVVGLMAAAGTLALTVARRVAAEELAGQLPADIQQLVERRAHVRIGRLKIVSRKLPRYASLISSAPFTG